MEVLFLFFALLSLFFFVSRRRLLIFVGGRGEGGMTRVTTAADGGLRQCAGILLLEISLLNSEKACLLHVNTNIAAYLTFTSFRRFAVRTYVVRARAGCYERMYSA